MCRGRVQGTLVGTPRHRVGLYGSLTVGTGLLGRVLIVEFHDNALMMTTMIGFVSFRPMGVLSPFQPRKRGRGGVFITMSLRYPKSKELSVLLRFRHFGRRDAVERLG